jgi:uncharacterized protein (DUF2141 family)
LSLLKERAKPELQFGFLAALVHSATNIMIMKVYHKQVHYKFQDIAPGMYALVAVHDENMNGKLDTNCLGVPTEGYGFSNKAKALLGSPSFSAANFPSDG